VDEAIDYIKDSDVTYAFQLYPINKVREEVATYREQHNKQQRKNGSNGSSSKLQTTLDSATVASLDNNEEWQNKLRDKFLRNPNSICHLINERRSSHEQRLEFYTSLLKFMQKLKSCSDANSTDDMDSVSFMSSQFKGVKNSRDLAILDYCAKKYLSLMNQFKNGSKQGNTIDDIIIDETNENGILLQIKIKKGESSPFNTYMNNDSTCTSSFTSNSWNVVGITPICVRISPTLTVMGLRQLLGRRVARALKTNGHDNDVSESSTMSLEMNTLRQVAISYDSNDRVGRSSTSKHGKNALNDGVVELGSVTMDQPKSITLKQPPPQFANPKDDQEQKVISCFVGEGDGSIVVTWPTHLNDILDESVMSTKEEYLTREQKLEREEEMAAALTKKKTGVSIMDCIEKYCELEQLDESDMWYCNKCKEHVRAWKQVSLYRTPPILIVHLKRFHYSSTTHRRDKIDTLIDFPLSGLDLSRIVKQESGSEPIYDCYAVSNHFGGLGGGHYTAYAKADDGVWRNFDDSRVTSDVDESEVVSSAAYCLFYKRRDVGSHLDSPGNAMVADSLSPSLWEEIDAGSMEVDGGSANTSVCSYKTPSSNLDEDFEMVESQV
jgi:hypothetical protein